MVGISVSGINEVLLNKKSHVQFVDVVAVFKRGWKAKTLMGGDLLAFLGNPGTAKYSSALHYVVPHRHNF